MSFDLHFLAFGNGEPVNADAAAARKVVESQDFSYDGRFSFLDLVLADGSALEIHASGLFSCDQPFSGAMIQLRGLNNSIGDFIFEFAHASKCVVITASDPIVVLMPNGDVSKHFPDDLAQRCNCVVVNSGSDVTHALTEEFQQWAEFRDQAAKSSRTDRSK